jgi:hypothetical protein
MPARPNIDFGGNRCGLTARERRPRAKALLNDLDIRVHAWADDDGFENCGAMARARLCA